MAAGAVYGAGSVRGRRDHRQRSCWLALGDQREARRRLVRNMFFIWLLMGIGFLASVMHLGSPLRAFNSLNRIGASALSNEIASGALFFAVGGFWWLLAVLEKMPATLGKVWLAIAMLLGLLFVLAMTRVYQINTVPTWYNGYTTSAFFLTVLLSGPLFAALLLRLAKVDFNGWFFAGLSVAALVISAAVIIMQSAGLSTFTARFSRRPPCCQITANSRRYAWYCWRWASAAGYVR